MEVACAAVVSGKAAGSRNRHGIIGAVEETHTLEVETDGTDKCQRGINTPYPAPCGAEAWVHTGTHRAGGFGGEDLDATADEGGKSG